MTPNPSWQDLALRLLCTVIAGSVLGWNRGEHVKSAGLRTNLLVCLAASIAMIQVNLLLDTRGRAWDSFMMADPMRLPLGILSGVGFIGGGAILQRRNLVVGVTTAATLWFVTVMGLCFGAGEFSLGGAAFGLGLMTLSGLQHFEQHWRQLHHAVLTISCHGTGPEKNEIVRRLKADGMSAALQSVTYGPQSELRYGITWRAKPGKIEPPVILKEIAQLEDVSRVNWKT